MRVEAETTLALEDKVATICSGLGSGLSLSEFTRVPEYPESCCANGYGKL